MLELGENKPLELGASIFLQEIKELEKYWAFNIETGENYSLNRTSYWILMQIGEGRPLPDISHDFINTFDVEEEVGKNDFDNIINNFLDEGIIERREENEERKSKI
jgi:hypothetical protein